MLHVVRYRREALGELIEAINATGYGLTFGVHTRLDETVDFVTAWVRAGNIYVNRNMIGAVVGVQPFGGTGLSGTGPKAGGPLYLGRLVETPPRLDLRGGQGHPLAAAFADWLDAHEEHDAALHARCCAEESMLGMERMLPGPVGERNLYALRPRGRVLMRPVTRAGLLAQMAAVLATGNTGTIEGMAPPAGLPPPIADAFATHGPEPFVAALVEGAPERLIDTLRELAEMPGRVVPVHAQGRGTPAYPLAFLLKEVSTSINTTAAGGNASLMMLD